MEYEVRKKLAKNYLTTKHHYYGEVVSFAILAMCFVLSQLYWSSSSISDLLVASGESVFEKGEYWRLLTTLFVHGDMGHLLSNSVMFTIMSYYVYSFYGLWAFPFLSLASGAFVNIGTLYFYDPHVNLVGISGVVYYLWGFWLVLYLCIQDHLSIHRRLMKVFIVGTFILVPDTIKENVSHMAHFLGFVTGVFTSTFFYLFKKSYFKKFKKWEYEVVELPDMDYLISEEEFNTLHYNHKV